MKKLIITFVLLLAVLMIFTACNDKKNNDPDPTQTTPADKPTEMTPVDTPSETTAVDEPLQQTQEKEYVMEHEFVFNEQMNEKLHGFSDYPIGEEEFYELAGGIEVIPDIEKYGYKLEGNNHSDDLFMYIAIPVEMRPNTTYEYTMKFNFATSVEGDAMGVGGSPGASVFVKAGAVGIKPQNKEENGYYRINIDKGNQGTQGKDLVNVGNIEKEDSSPDGIFATKLFGASGEVTTGDDGIVYLVVGTDSGFEAKTTVYLVDLSVEFK